MRIAMTLSILFALTGCGHEVSITEMEHQVAEQGSVTKVPGDVSEDETTELEIDEPAWCIPQEYRLRDLDGDGYGDPEDTIFVSVCDDWQPGWVNWIEGRGDCNDANSDVHPGASEICDWIADNNCDGVQDGRELDGNGELGGPDGYTVCFPYHTQLDVDGDTFCSTGMDLNGDGDCIDPGDIIFPADQVCPAIYHDCDVMDPDIYPGNGC